MADNHTVEPDGVYAALIREAVVEAREAWDRFNRTPTGLNRYKRDGLAQRMFVQGYVAARMNT